MKVFITNKRILLCRKSKISKKGAIVHGSVSGYAGHYELNNIFLLSRLVAVSSVSPVMDSLNSMGNASVLT